VYTQHGLQMKMPASLCSIRPTTKGRFWFTPGNRQRRASSEDVKGRWGSCVIPRKRGGMAFYQNFPEYIDPARWSLFTVRCCHSSSWLLLNARLYYVFILGACFHVHYLLLRIVQSLYWLMGDRLRLPVGTKCPEQPRKQPNPSLHAVEKLIVFTQEIQGLFKSPRIRYYDHKSPPLEDSHDFLIFIQPFP
jgi:hypothetical protein